MRFMTRLAHAFLLLSLVLWLAAAPNVAHTLESSSSTLAKAEEVSTWLKSLADPSVPADSKKLLTAKIYYDLDSYRNAAQWHPDRFPATGPLIDHFQKHRQRMIFDVIQRMRNKYFSRHKMQIRGAIVPFAYNNIYSDDDIVLSSGPEGRNLEKYFNESLDELMQERTDRPFTAADRARIDINGLGWDMTLEAGATRNFEHHEKYIQPESGIANQGKLMGTGDNLFVAKFDENGMLIVRENDNGKFVSAGPEEAVAKLRTLDTDTALKIPGLPDAIGTASMADYHRMARIHQIESFDLPKNGMPDAIYSDFPKKTAQFIRNQKYTQRLVSDIQGLVKHLTDNGTLDAAPKELRDYERHIEIAGEIRGCLSIACVAQLLATETNGVCKQPCTGANINVDSLGRAMFAHQQIQLEMMTKLVSLGATLEAPEVVRWLKAADKGQQQELRKRIALRFSAYDPKEVDAILQQIQNSKTLEADDFEWLRGVMTRDASRVRDYGDAVAKAMASDSLADLQNRQTFRNLFADWLQPRGPNDRVLLELEMRSPNLSGFKQLMVSRESGRKLYEFSKTRMGQALNLDTMLDGSGTSKSVLGGMVVLSMYRAYHGSQQGEGLQSVAYAAVSILPGITATEYAFAGEYRLMVRDLVFEVMPPLALAELARSLLETV